MQLDVKKMVAALLVIGTVGTSVSFLFMYIAVGFMREAIIMTQPAPAVEIELERLPPGGPYCPGEFFDFGVRLEPLRAPITVRIAKTMWDRDKRRNAVGQIFGQELVLNYTDTEVVHTADRFFIPTRDRLGEPIAPGNYEVRLSAVAEGAAPAIVPIEFSVGQECPSE